MELFEGACCSLQRHQDLVARTMALLELDSRYGDYYIGKNLELGDEKKDNES